MKRELIVLVSSLCLHTGCGKSQSRSGGEDGLAPQQSTAPATPSGKAGEPSQAQRLPTKLIGACATNAMYRKFTVTLVAVDGATGAWSATKANAVGVDMPGSESGEYRFNGQALSLYDGAAPRLVCSKSAGSMLLGEQKANGYWTCNNVQGSDVFFSKTTCNPIYFLEDGGDGGGPVRPETGG